MEFEFQVAQGENSFVVILATPWEPAWIESEVDQTHIDDAKRDLLVYLMDIKKKLDAFIEKNKHLIPDGL